RVGEQAAGDVVRDDLAVEQPLLGARHPEGLDEQVVQLDHLDPAVAQLEHEVLVVPLRVLHPQDVVEQQARRCCSGSGARAPAPAGTRAPCGACRPPSGRRTSPATWMSPPGWVAQIWTAPVARSTAPTTAKTATPTNVASPGAVN